MFKIVNFDTKEDGLGTIFKDYQEVAMRYLWRLKGEGASSRDVWVNVNRDLMGKRTISRASIINFLNHMVDEGAVKYHEITGKGGHRRIYSSVLDEAGFKCYIAKEIISKLLDTWPEATTEIIESITDADDHKETEKSKDSSLSLTGKLQRDAKKILKTDEAT